MSRAATRAYRLISQYWCDHQQVLILCGNGNNAGDGYLVACLAKQAGKDVHVYSVTDSKCLSGDAAKAAAQWKALGEVIKCEDDGVEEALQQADVIVDAMLGIGLCRPLAEPYLDIVSKVNEVQSAGVIALNIPTGLNADSGFGDPKAIIHADLTVSFIAAKRGMYTGIGPHVCGDIVVDDLGVDFSVKSAEFNDSTVWRGISDQERISHFPARDAASHKGTHGTAVLVGGSLGMEGAIILAAEAAMRAGAGKTLVCHQGEAAMPLLARLPAAMSRILRHAEDDLAILRESATAVAIGPGMGQANWGQGVMESFTFLVSQGLPVVLDADALNLLALANKKFLTSTWHEHGHNIVITPHPAEAARLLGQSTAEVQHNRFAAVAALVERYHCVVVLKGAGTLISNGSEHYLCTRGNAGMAVAGMGDVLTGIIVSLMAQGMVAINAARLGVQLHAHAGDLAAADNGQRGMLPNDLSPYIQQLVNP